MQEKKNQQKNSKVCYKRKKITHILADNSSNDKAFLIDIDLANQT